MREDMRNALLMMVNNVKSISNLISSTKKDYSNIHPQQRQWILDQINQGKLDNATLLYDKSLAARGKGTHAHALAEVVEELRGTVQQDNVTQSQTALGSQLSLFEEIDIWSKGNEFSSLSNMNRDFPLTETVDGKETKFDSIEQVFQIKKALFAGDRNMANKMYKTNNSFEIKRLGSKRANLIKWIKGTPKQWDLVSYNEMKKSIKLSLEQNPEKLELLLKTGNATLTHKNDNTNWKTDFPKILMELRGEFQNSLGFPTQQLTLDELIKDAHKEC
jgi:predicted NAD-dependent protein-ADP-ribosyltransferase YbiA (DUF1768 family)